MYIKLYKGYGWLWLDHVDPNHWTMVTPRSLEGSSLVRSPSARDPYPLDQGGAENCNITFFEGRGVKNVILQYSILRDDVILQFVGTMMYHGEIKKM